MDDIKLTYLFRSFSRSWQTKLPVTLNRYPTTLRSGKEFSWGTRVGSKQVREDTERLLKLQGIKKDWTRIKHYLGGKHVFIQKRLAECS